MYEKKRGRIVLWFALFFVPSQHYHRKKRMKIGIIVAMDKELQQLQHLFTDGNVIVQKCGIGKVNAALGAAEMIAQYKPDVIISSGCAGGNGDDVNIQDVVVSTELTYHDVYCGEAIGHSVYGQVQGLPARYQADPMLLDKAVSSWPSAISQMPNTKSKMILLMTTATFFNLAGSIFILLFSTIHIACYYYIITEYRFQ